MHWSSSKAYTILYQEIFSQMNKNSKILRSIETDIQE